ncbi:hypothetical protein PHLGIDRAFT_401426 [Phlebiopsis gigantea 11061_1 CR5-6]|uniref:DUF6533 domain-containing protein n=1 Tax=Phlebiopsis gigantea (strain 11061_1 CR5-6) TaxID=745531 RepID=A0A0C3RZT5_PHLG1|nr:hypothetical protein PHLGIDRAFT_401426 [Phlebiopsis gigantea 11061_1 CR5-6]
MERSLQSHRLTKLLWQKYTCIAAIALAVYEYVITFEQEMNTVWKRKLNWTSVFLLAIRYTTLLDAILQASLLLAGGELRSIRNRPGYYFGHPYTRDRFCALRVYALSNHSILVAGLVFVYGGWTPFVFDLIISARSTSSFAPPPYNICVISACRSYLYCSSLGERHTVKSA